ncbi:MAG: hypothetical protein U9N62_12490 [Thermotogota bacterium]|nr:hypothetical protein [Thermotogota bacterium]
MRRFHAISLLVLLVAVTSVFSLSFDNSIEEFKTYIEHYQNEESKFAPEFDFMSIYRKYSLAICGGVKSDQHDYDVNDLLEEIYNEYKTGVPEEDITLAAFFAYVSADLFGDTFDITVLNKFPPFYKAYNEYVQSVKNYANEYFAQWIGYAIGLVSEPPDDLFDVERSSQRLRMRLTLDYEYNEELHKILEENIDAATQEKLNDAINKIKGELRRDPDERTLERAINRYSIAIFSSVIDNINDQKDIISDLFIENAPRETNWWILRFLVYTGLFLIALKIKKILPFMLSAIIIFDAFFLILSGNLARSDIEALIYGMISIMFFAFALILYSSSFFNKAKNMRLIGTHAILIIIVLMLYLIPMFISPEVMKMDEYKAFYESPAYEALKDDVIGWEFSYLNEPFVEYNNTNLTAQKADEELVKRYKKVIGYAGKLFKESVNEFMEGKLADERYKELTEIAGLVPNYDPETKSPNIQMYNTTSGAVILMFITLICSIIIVLKPKVFESILYMSVVLFFSVFFLFQNAHYFIVEKGFPLIHYEQVSPSYLLLIGVIILSVLSIYLFFKTEGKDS